MHQPAPLPQLRYDIREVTQILRISRATLYDRIREGRLSIQKDGRRTFITSNELMRYIDSSQTLSTSADMPPVPRTGKE